MMQAAVYAGNSVGPFIGGLVFDNYNFRVACFAAACLLTIGGLLVQFGTIEHFTPPELSSERKRGGTILEVLRSGSFIICIFMFFQIAFATNAPAPSFVFLVEEISKTAHGDWLSRTILKILGSVTHTTQTATISGAMTCVVGLVAAASAGTFGRLGDIWGHKKLLIICTLMAGVFSIPQAFVETLGQLLILRIFYGLTIAGIMPSANSILRSITHPKNIGKAYGIMQSFRSMGFALGPLAGGLLAKRISMGAPFMLTGVVFVIVAPFIAMNVRPNVPSDDMPHG